MEKTRMASSLSLHSIQPLNATNIEHHQQHSTSVVVEEIEGLIKVYKDGRVERQQVVPCVDASYPIPQAVTCFDEVIDRGANIWARFYVPECQACGDNNKLPLVVYFHGGGFCVGSSSWVCYHEFLAKLAAKADCMIVSVNYRLAPESPLPAAYEDGLKTVMWVKQQAQVAAAGFLSRVAGSNDLLWVRKCDFTKVFLAGDSAGANIAYHVSNMLNSDTLSPLFLKGIILIQPFFGGELRTYSEKYLTQQARSALTLEASESYWRMALPQGANRDHPWGNPVHSMKCEDKQTTTMVCISDMDIMRDRNLEFCAALASGGTKVETVVHKGVCHAFQILDKSEQAQNTTLEMIIQVKNFINR